MVAAAAVPLALVAALTANSAPAAGQPAPTLEVAPKIDAATANALRGANLARLDAFDAYDASASSRLVPHGYSLRTGAIRTAAAAAAEAAAHKAVAHSAAVRAWEPYRPIVAPHPEPVITTQAAVTGPNGRLLGTFVITCYDLQGSTASGAPVSTETVAVDPSVIPLGSRIYIEGVGIRIAQDTGGAIVGDRLDIWEPTYGDCAAWGVESRQVWLES